MDGFIEILSIIWEWYLSHITSINTILAIVIVFFQRRDPKSTWGWLLLLYFIPVLGFFLYLVIGHNFHKNKMFRIKEVEDELNAEILLNQMTILENQAEQDVVLAEILLNQMGGENCSHSYD